MKKQATVDVLDIEDTLFGEPKGGVAVLENGPIEGCYCICSCLNQLAKANNNTRDYADVFTADSPPV